MNTQQTSTFHTILTFCVIGLAGLTVISQPDVKRFLSDQLAGISNFDIRKVYDYQRSKGLTHELAMGDTGEDVKLVQHALHTLDFDFPEDNVTGYFGQQTSNALSRYQKEAGLSVTGILDDSTRAGLDEIYFKELCPEAEDNDFDDEILIQVNRTKPLPEKYVPEDLVRIPDTIKTIGVACLKEEVIPHLEELVQDAEYYNIRIAVTSGFRKPEIQGVIYGIWASILGDKVSESVAEPFHSEHQLGTTIDFSGASNQFIGGDNAFAGTMEDMWLKNNAYKYGFVMSYPDGKMSITGYTYEPWHYRYVGTKIAREIFEEEISVEEYFASENKSKKKSKKKR